ncbi:TRAP transporter small permease [Jiella mangrovi]|uniref:TRAP transporter small permease protein n=1 Tax=Jiella mangrovi TaxID=2821407 RepID=A0ABS4BEB9_9HYPH|nr:TRAP transporter small permease [Jiella mangrovi]MBP0615100.1 TRAP transporter small permease [Jiella mangrovi]
MKRLAMILHGLSDRLNLAAEFLSALMFLGMLLTVLLQVVARYIFHSPPFWTEELARWLMVWGGLLGATVAFHTRTDPAIVNPPKDHPGRQKVQIVSRFVAAWLFFLPVIWFCYPFVLRQIDRPSEGLHISTAWMAMALPISAILTCLHALSGLLSLSLYDQRSVQAQSGQSELEIEI